GCHGETARGIAEQRDDPEWHAAERAAQVGGVEYPDVGARHAGRRELRASGAGYGGDRGIGALLAAVRGGDERSVAARAGEDDVARLVADQQRTHDATA